jgi:hypothetical protein
MNVVLLPVLALLIPVIAFALASLASAARPIEAFAAGVGISRRRLALCLSPRLTESLAGSRRKIDLAARGRALRAPPCTTDMADVATALVPRLRAGRSSPPATARVSSRSTGTPDNSPGRTSPV